MTGPPSRCWQLTIFQNDFTLPDPVPAWLRYLVGQREICPQTERKHYHLHVELSRPQRLGALQLAFGAPGCHGEVVRSRSGSITYCTKPETRDPDPHSIEFGERGRGQGERTDLNDLRDSFAVGFREGGARAAWEAAYGGHFRAALAYSRGLQAYQRHLSYRTRTEAPQVEIHEGSTGTGKTRQAYERFPGLWRSPPAIRSQAIWWDGYYGQAAALIDEFDGETFPIALMLQVLDRYPLQLPCKGGFIDWAPDVIMICTNLPFTHWYGSVPNQQRAALQRRITKYWSYFTGGDAVELTRSQWEVPDINV